MASDHGLTNNDLEFNSPDRFTQAGTERKRTRKACRICHSHKARCSGTIPHCKRCEQRGYVCEYESTSRGMRRSVPRQQPAGTSQNGDSPGPGADAISAGGSPMDIGHGTDGSLDLGISKATIKLYIDAYFEFVSSTPGKGFIHRATFLRNWNNGAVNPALLEAMCASSIAFVSKDNESRATAQRWMDEAERYVWQSLSRPTTVLVEVLLVIIFYRFEHREYFKSQALTAVAAKMAFVLGLNYENNALSTLVRECRRRLMWSIFHVDRLSAGGFPELLVCPSHSMHIQLPCSEKDFDLGIPGETAPLISTRTNEAESMHLGLRTFYFRISDIRHRILEYTRNVIREKSNPYDSQDTLQKLEEELQQLRSSLPANLQYNEDNLFLRAYSPQLTRFVMFHVLWQQCHADLYRFMFPGTKDSISDTVLEDTPQEYVQYCQRKAFEHAVMILDICNTVQSIGHTLISDIGIATCVYQCSNIIVRAADIVGFSSEDERVRIMGRLEKVTDILEGLREVNTHVDDIYRNVKEMLHLFNTNQTRRLLANPVLGAATPSLLTSGVTPGPVSLDHINYTNGHNTMQNHNPLHLSSTGVLAPTTESAATLSLLEIGNGNDQYADWNSGNVDDGGQWINGIDFGQAGMGSGIGIGTDMVGNVGAMFDPFWGIHNTNEGGSGTDHGGGNM
ncbi:hypothetical protein SS1G_02678 [Sclerotinia sclerotiorum 1980 UF-70]|uniref:Zn(2)-C6 fungal-type domain-containing protein n=2 Tax=Sclerotinia sclerotiorum (strain ATCC 18683 / 1980 / Ss-1) TaxID=665079 RepID=A7EBJ2_SCLS1|nr:hypothetical protein SS1G_02678 [Sclerotinia sclerotiorum 1980 UF-70]APA08867.1 hypothetical protein sscle_04g036370 [Sclerotinia sclerotiorum 1980 UF-70]EDN99820.1 hypothetical protein SS1G_02678 [Sclerotinia sclerotiorum 1980 UF-70]